MSRIHGFAPALAGCVVSALAFVNAEASEGRKVAIWPLTEAHRALVATLGLPIERQVGDAWVSGDLDAEILAGLAFEGIPYRILEASPSVALRAGTVDVRVEPLRPAHFPAPDVVVPFVVALRDAMDDTAVAAIERAGARVVGPLPPAGVLARGDLLAAARIASLASVYGVAPLAARHRIGPGVEWGASAVGLQQVDVGGFAGDSIRGVEAAVSEFGRVVATFSLGERPVVRAEVDGTRIEALASLPNVEWIDAVAAGETFNDKIRVLMQTERTHHSANQHFYNPVYGIGVFGSGQTVAITDQGIRPTHEAFFGPGKLLAYYVPANSTATLGDEQGHGSGVSCTLGGDSPGAVSGGFGWPNDLDGLGIRTSLIVQDIADANGVLLPPPDVITDVHTPAFQAGARVHNHSYGHGPTTGNPTAGYYSMLTQAIDAWLKAPARRASVQVYADGNFGPTLRSLSEEAHAKNVISVGGCRNGSSHQIMYTFSSRGPTTDCIGGCATLGRVKPDMLAPGSLVDSADSWGDEAYFGPWFGTSFAAPAVSAAAALVRDYFAQGIYPVVPSDPPLGGEPSSALIKAMLVNSTVFLNDPSAWQGNALLGLPANTYPNFDQGYGRPALDTVLEPAGYRKLKVYEDASTQAALGSVWTRNIKFKEKWHAACSELRVTLAWTDPAMTMGAAQALVHDLDLEVDFQGQTYRGNFRHTGGPPDRLNNVEDVFLPTSPFALNQVFTIQVRVLGTSVTPQARQYFAVVATYGPCFDNTPCPGIGGCYAGPGDIVPGSTPPSNPCEGQHYTYDECVDCGSDPQPDCDPPGYDPADPDPVGGPQGGG